MDLEEFKRRLEANKKEIERLMAEADQVRINSVASRNERTSIEEMRAYNNRVRNQIIQRESYWKLPWWKRLFTKYPEFIA